MILIADCGSTKIEWCLLDNKEIVKQIVTCGMNAIMLTEAEIEQRLRDELSNEVSGFNVSDVYFYGAGCISDDICNNVAKAIRANIPTAKNVEVSTDLLAAARALCGNKPGIACILGTGSNSCYYDGTNICDNVSPLGYILGDEGSGAVLGKILLGDVLKNQLPKHLCEKFLTQYGLDRLSIIRRVYKEPQGNRFMASITPFLIENISEPSIYAIVYNAFKSFFVRNIAQYDGYKSLDVNFIGSIAFYYKDVLEKVAADMGCRIGKILKSPMDGLIQFHTV
jgi:N-acetylglucosamine kinase-like BadF-type ATPase